MNKFNSLSGKTFYRLTAIREGPPSPSGQTRWYWKCSCGNDNELLIRCTSVIRGITRSCGCYQKERFIECCRFPQGVSAFNRLFYTYKLNSKKREILFSLTKEEFKNLVQQSCYYCGIEPENIVTTKHKNSGGFTYNGIDRVDNTVGYIPDNCVPCCETCNRAKLKMSKEAFLFWVDRVYNHTHSLATCRLKEWS